MPWRSGLRFRNEAHQATALTPSRIVAAISSLAVVAAVALLAAPPASAQQPAAEDQYVDTGPTGNGVDGSVATSDVADDGGAINDELGASSGGAESGAATGSSGPGSSKSSPDAVSATGNGETGGGSLPFTDYPATPLVDLMLLLLAIAFAVPVGRRFALSRFGDDAPSP